MVNPLLQELSVYRAIGYYGVPVLFVHVVAGLYTVVLFAQGYSFIRVTFYVEAERFAFYAGKGKNFTFYFEA
jgi:hypothetical protein